MRSATFGNVVAIAALLALAGLAACTTSGTQTINCSVAGTTNITCTTSRNATLSVPISGL